MLSNNKTFTKENLDQILNELSKEYKKLGGRKIPVEIVLIGGAAIISNYGFREMTSDVDAILSSGLIMKEAINSVGDRLNLPNNWLNSDFTKTSSYSTKIIQYSVPYKTFNQVLHVRILNGAHLIAMKLMSGRKYKNDLSDIVGILDEHQKNNREITLEMIDRAVHELYGGWDDIPKDSAEFINSIMKNRNYEKVFLQIRKSEQQSREVILESQKANPSSSTASKEAVINQLKKLK